MSVTIVIICISRFSKTTSILQKSIGCNVVSHGFTFFLVSLQTAVAENVVGLEYQGIFDVGVVDKLTDGRKERLHVLVGADVGGVDTDMGHVVLLRQFSMASALARKSITRH